MDLPPELLRNVFLLLEAPKDLISCAQVSKQWKEISVSVLRNKQPHILQHENLKRYSSMLENGYPIHRSLTICIKNECPTGINTKETLEQIEKIAMRAKTIHLHLSFNHEPKGSYDQITREYSYDFGDRILTKNDVLFVISSVKQTLVTLRFINFYISYAYFKDGPILLPMQLNSLEKIEFFHAHVNQFLRCFQFPADTSQYDNLKQINFKIFKLRHFCGNAHESHREDLENIEAYFQRHIPKAAYNLEIIASENDEMTRQSLSRQSRQRIF